MAWQMRAMQLAKHVGRKDHSDLDSTVHELENLKTKLEIAGKARKIASAGSDRRAEEERGRQEQSVAQFASVVNVGVDHDDYHDDVIVEEPVGDGKFASDLERNLFERLEVCDAFCLCHSLPLFPSLRETVACSV